MSPRNFSPESLEKRFKKLRDNPERSDAFLERQASIPNWALYYFFDGNSARKEAIEGYLDRKHTPVRALDLNNPISVGTRGYYAQQAAGADVETNLELLVEAPFIDNQANLKKFVTNETMPL